jgi:hypothetical protein
MWTAEDAAKVMANAIARRRQELVFTTHGRAAAFLGQHFPKLTVEVFRRSGFRRGAKR